MYVYKVVYVDESGKRISAFLRHKACVVYKPGEWIEPPRWLAARGYYLTAFREYRFAKQLADSLPLYTEVWLAEADGILTDLPPRCDIVAIDIGELEPLEIPWPTGTVMCRRLKLLRRVWWW